MADSRMAAQSELEGVEILTVSDIRSLLTEHAAKILRAMGSVPVLGPALEEAHPIDTRTFVRSMAPHLTMN